MIEPFKIIPGFNNQFMATCDGNIYDVKNKRYLHKTLHKGRYEVYLPGFRRYNVHILVAKAYHGEPPFENADVHHCNLNKLDNCPQNLVYLTHGIHSALHCMLTANEGLKKAQEVSAKLPRTEKQLKAARETIKRAIQAAAKLPRTEKQLESSRETIKRAIQAAAKLPRTEKQLESSKETIKNAIKASSKPVIQYDLNNSLIAIYPSMHEAERQTGISRKGISACANGIRESYKGFKWTFSSS